MRVCVGGGGGGGGGGAHLLTKELKFICRLSGPWDFFIYIFRFLFLISYDPFLMSCHLHTNIDIDKRSFCRLGIGQFC